MAGLSKGEHSVESRLRPGKTVQALKERIDVRCIADIDLQTLAGQGHLIPVLSGVGRASISPLSKVSCPKMKVKFVTCAMKGTRT
jgi:hypothetical protein